MNVLQKADSSVSTPSTPNSSSLSSQSNLIGNSTTPQSTPSPATPTASQHNSSSIPQAPPTPGNSLTYKNSLKGTKLARRARSFKDDLFEKFSLMRTPNNTLGRSHSPHSPRSRNASSKPPPTAEDVARSTQSLETHVKDICNALKHFRDVILKKKLEVLPGNGTVILETIASMYAVIQSYTLNENSTVLLSATQQVYQSLGKLIKLCDEVMLSEESNECASLSNDNVREVVDLLEDAVKNLVNLAQQKLKEKEESAFKYGPSIQDIAAAAHSQNHLMRPPVEVAGQRTSLPDITLTPKERDILEKTKSVPIRASHSTESILRDTSPPPKPPLPNRTTIPPPLPPKPRSQQHLQNSQFNSNNISINSDLDCSSDFSFMNYGVDHLSVRSRSPDENSSQCSLDSALNHSREEEELKILGLENRIEETQMGITGNGDVNKSSIKVTTNNHVGSSAGVGMGNEKQTNADLAVNNSILFSSIAAGIQNVATATVMAAGKSSTGGGTDSVDSSDKAELRQQNSGPNHRHSNESGFVSMKSFRTSTQSVSKRSSDYSFQSSNKSSSSEMVLNTSECSSSRHQTIIATNSFGSATTTSTTGITAATSSSTSSEQHITTSSSKVFTTSNSNTTINDLSSIASLVQRSSTSPEPKMISERHQSKIQSFHSFTNTNSLDTSLSDCFASTENIEPPLLPPKTSKNRDRFHHDNFDEMDDANSIGDVAELRHNYHHHQQHHHVIHLQSKHQSLAGSCVTIAGDNNLEKPPPLPMKKKHILAYMEICSTRSNEQQHRHTMHAYNVNHSRNITHSQTMNIVPQPQELSPDNELPPALPPKINKQFKTTSLPPTIITTPPPSPKPNNLSADPYNSDGVALRHPRILSINQGSEPMTTVNEELDDEKTTHLHHSHNLPNADKISDNIKAISPEIVEDETTEISGDLDKLSYHNNNNSINNNNDDDNSQDLDKINNKSNTSNANSPDNMPNLLEEIDITPYLVLKKEGEEGPEVKGGYIDALIVHASRVQKVSDAFSEAFITTFRTFIQPIDVIEKLTHRYTVFFCQMNDQKQRAAKETFALLVRVVNDLTSTDLTNQLLTLLVEFIYQLVCSGQLYLAKLLRNTFVDKVKLYKALKMTVYAPDMYHTVTNQPSLLDLKSLDIAEQMTLLDAELFQKIEIPEVLLFAKEQCEEKSPNLNKFTEHFNKMSYWARSKILTLVDAKEREKHVFKFIKIMKHLRKMNNYNSYLALLSALDSAPIRRLEWQKTITESLKEYIKIIDSSSSFRVYRQSLADTSPPCIPYIGLVLQDLTFVHVGNPDYLREGVINFSKRWQQYNIIVNMKRFKKCAYPFRRNERIIRFFENFENFLGEEEMWQISESIKPRGKRTVQY